MLETLGLGVSKRDATLRKGKGKEYLHQLCRTLPATYEVDYIRVFQTKEPMSRAFFRHSQDQQAEDRQGCSPKALAACF